MWVLNEDLVVRDENGKEIAEFYDWKEAQIAVASHNMLPELIRVSNELDDQIRQIGFEDWHGAEGFDCKSFRTALLRSEVRLQAAEDARGLT